MHGILEKLQVGAIDVATLDVDTAKQLLQRADAALDAAQSRIVALTAALRDLVDIADAGRPKHISEVRRRLLHAQGLLAAPVRATSLATDQTPSLNDAPKTAGGFDGAPAQGAPAASVRPAARMQSDEPEAMDEGHAKSDLDNLKRILKTTWAI